MGRRKNNPELVDELIEGRWTMDQDEFEQKYFSLSSSDRSKVADAIDGMESEFMQDDDEDEEYGERLSVDDAALAWMSNGFDDDETDYGYTAEEMRDALK